MRRFEPFEYLRVFALGLILACHFSRSVGCKGIDIALGALGNIIFFALSGWLLGLSWRIKGYNRLGGRWLSHRIMRLCIPLWVFVVPYLVYLHHDGYHLNVKEVILNMSLMNWFARLPGTTPYWFLTAITMFYMLISMLTHVPDIQKKRLLCVIVGIAIVAGGQGVLAWFNIRQGYALTLFFCGLLTFLYGEELLAWIVRKHSVRYVAIFAGGVGIMLFIVECFVFGKGWIKAGETLGYWISLPVAGLASYLILALASTWKRSGAIQFLAGISFEMYLVHSAMLNFTCSFSTNIITYLVLFLSGTFLLAYGVNKCASFIRSLWRHVNVKT